MDDHFSPSIDELVAANLRFAEAFDGARINVRPNRRMAIVTCMDSRMDMFAMLGLGNGEAHVIRNAGGVVTDDVIRSLCLSQRRLGTREIVLIHHTHCGLMQVKTDDFFAELEAAVGVRPRWALEAFTDPFAEIRQNIQRLHNTPFVEHTDHIRGFVYDVETGLLSEVHPPEPGSS
jgi:carbonic anhydrase